MPLSRFEGWLERFGAGHGGAGRLVAGGRGSALLRAPDGAGARLSCPGVDLAGGRPAGEALTVEDVVARVVVPRVAAVLLLRRGGAVVALVRTGAGGPEVLSSLVRTARVQSRTAAGGWSQQRFARRREGQAEGLVRDAVAAAGRVWAPADGAGRPDLLAVGGDRPLLERALVLLPAALAGVAALPRQDLDVRADPRRRVLDALAPDVGAVRAEVRDAWGVPPSSP
ncbi:acVLRF1 family peptidyl-tRNA hydrolase [uncultured Pseudokineococcus sp.]|uniref:acVLRF1 family peptidyl-tRNA hydrolase n=1 Tax=uncultured Pseudokineococcus sp. TaxID=1642928 RepID=UPI0026202B8E|nr:acVLRF1 family peptidyl-tRNA hydrolase [uncultured Pseudokineococcus sp.]